MHMFVAAKILKKTKSRLAMSSQAPKSCLSLMTNVSPAGFKDEVLLATILKEALKCIAALHANNRVHWCVCAVAMNATHLSLPSSAPGISNPQKS